MSCLQVPLHQPLLCTQVAPLQETKGWPGLENRAAVGKHFTERFILLSQRAPSVQGVGLTLEKLGKYPSRTGRGRHP